MTIILKPTLDVIIRRNQNYARDINEMIHSGKAEMKQTQSGINYLKIYDDENYQV